MGAAKVLLRVRSVRPEINQENSGSGRHAFPNTVKKFEHAIKWEAVNDIRDDDGIVILWSSVLGRERPGDFI